MSHFLANLLDFVLHLDTHLVEIVGHYGILTYLLLFFTIFAETGLVFFPFLPGDSLLFAAGAIAALGAFNIWVLIFILFLAAVLGDAANYFVGHFLGHKIVDNPNITLINQEHIDKTEQFYKKHGGKAIVLARFVPIVRTFAPFVAGIGKMSYSQFLAYNALGGFMWTTLFTLLGYYFGNLPFIKNNFHYAIFAIIALSLLPMIYEYYRNKNNLG